MKDDDDDPPEFVNNPNCVSTDVDYFSVKVQDNLYGRLEKLSADQDKNLDLKTDMARIGQRPEFFQVSEPIHNMPELRIFPTL